VLVVGSPVLARPVCTGSVYVSMYSHVARTFSGVVLYSRMNVWKVTKMRAFSYVLLL
jgi:hypothetical protein